MKQGNIIAAILGVTLATTLISCKKENDPPPPTPPVDTVVKMTPYELPYPAYFPKAYIPDDNKLYEERIQLGRMLYYDPILSRDGRACASCHLQEKGFTVPGLYAGMMPVLPHVNLAWNTNYMWDGSKKGTVEELMLFEVSEFFGTDLDKMNASTKYRDLFKKYYGADNISYKELSYALAQFIRTLVSKDTKFERFMQGRVNLSQDEYMGYRIFTTEKGDCFHCHVNPIMTDNLFHNTGLDSPYLKTIDKGLFNVTGNAADMGKFRTANLRNVALRDHYMHDGRFTTLEQVVEFYNSGVKRVSTVDPIMTKPGKEKGLNLTEMEKKQLVAFLKTLTDSTFITDPKLGKPE
ncbi:cytochrome-c peroxidase [Polluticoccus soli]|uniref:cytochrome-c peroxidase n=1 Tax=Polluticoccus soli TaxID=3034150 RepID=UPI0023E1BC06|nr:cytochrome c peroxidase [Flavipsychrobacter sp. JY13-12]